MRCYLPGISQVDAFVEAIEVDGLGRASSYGVVRIAEGARIRVWALFLADELHIESILQAKNMRHADGRRFGCKDDVLAGILLKALGDKSTEGCQHARKLGVVDVEIHHPKIIVIGNTREWIQQTLLPDDKRELGYWGRGGGGHFWIVE